MKRFKYFLFLVFLLPLFSCQEEDDLGESNIEVSSEKNEIDQWIYENITVPYNVEIKYKWDDSELEFKKILTPPAIDKVIPFLEVLKEAWIEPYEKAGGKDFIRKTIPKQIVLVGSRNYNSDGTLTLGTAEGGRKVVLYRINEFNKQNIDLLKSLFHVMHHEYGHILHQTILYPEEFKMITPGGYTSDWFNVKEQDALDEGFISSYAKNIIDDDWVETIAFMLTNTKEGFDARVAKAAPKGQAILKQKEKYVATYFDQVWNIDIYALQKNISDILESYREEPKP